jgi:hypothetical protein
MSTVDDRRQERPRLRVPVAALRRSPGARQAAPQPATVSQHRPWRTEHSILGGPGRGAEGWPSVAMIMVIAGTQACLPEERS